MKLLKNYLPALLCMTIINAVVLYHFIRKGQLMHGIGYFAFFYVALALIYFFTLKYPSHTNIVIKKTEQELTTSLYCIAIGFVVLLANFKLNTQAPGLSVWIRFPMLLIIALFAFPVAILNYFLYKKYNLLQLGLRTVPSQSFLLGLIIFGLTGLFAFIFNKEGIVWSKPLPDSSGMSSTIMKGFLTAGVAEEFTRFIVQTRFEKLFKSRGFHIVFSSALWALSYFPVTYFNTGNLTDTFSYCLQILPLGFVWGFLTDQTKSMLPSTLAHGLFAWGF